MAAKVEDKPTTLQEFMNFPEPLIGMLEFPSRLMSSFTTDTNEGKRIKYACL